MIPLDPKRAAVAERVLFKGLLAFALLWPIGVLTGSNPWTFYDASVYYRAGQAYLEGANLYQSVEFRQWPLVAFLCAPFALLPLRAAGAVMGALSWLGGFAGLACVLKRLRRDGASPPRLCIALTALGTPFLVLFDTGQMTGLAFAAYAVGLLLIDRRPRLAGACFALMAVKPHLALIALPALIAAGPAALVGFVAAGLCWPVGSLLVGGLPGLVEYAAQLARVRGTVPNTVTLASLLPLPVEMASQLQLLALIGLIVWLACMVARRLWAGRPATPASVDVGAISVLALLPYASVYDLVFAAPLLMRLSSRVDRRLVILFAAWWLLLGVQRTLAPYGGAGLLGMIPPAIVGVWLGRQRAGGSAVESATARPDPAEADRAAAESPVGSPVYAAGP
jgi:hypothetical protein